MARTGSRKRKAIKNTDRDNGFWWYEDIRPNRSANIKISTGLEQPASSAFDPAPPIHTGALAGSW